MHHQLERQAEAIRALGGDTIRIVGVGGGAMAEQGLKSLFPLDATAVMGLREVVPRIPEILSRVRVASDYALATRPDALVCIDSPDFTHRIARRGIAYETSGIDAAYLARLNDAYARFFHEYDRAPLLIVNASNIDPVQNQADFDELLGAIRRMKKGRMYYNPLRHGTI